MLLRVFQIKIRLHVYAVAVGRGWVIHRCELSKQNAVRTKHGGTMNARAHVLGLSWCSASLQLAGSFLAEPATSRSKESSRGVQVLGSSGSLGFAWPWDLVSDHLGKWSGGKKAREMCQNQGTFWEQSKPAQSKGSCIFRTPCVASQ